MSSPVPDKSHVGPVQLLIASVVGFGLILGGIAVLLLTPLYWAGLVMAASGFALRAVVVVLRGINRWRAFVVSPSAWWYNSKTHQIVEGRTAPGLRWDGPYLSQQDAARAPEIALSRAAEWNTED